ncbi:MAG: hypothetical protein ACI8WB_005931 [Phenylobacterium sp.]|jgi:hypothetical protein
MATHTIILFLEGELLKIFPVQTHLQSGDTVTFQAQDEVGQLRFEGGRNPMEQLKFPMNITKGMVVTGQVVGVPSETFQLTFGNQSGQKVRAYEPTGTIVIDD